MRSLRLERRGKHLIPVCDGTACHVQGAGKLVNEMVKKLGIPAGGAPRRLRVHYGDRLLPGLVRSGPCRRD